MQVLRSILAAVKAGGTNSILDIDPAAQAYLQPELALNQVGGWERAGEGRGKQPLQMNHWLDPNGVASLFAKHPLPRT